MMNYKKFARSVGSTLFRKLHDRKLPQVTAPNYVKCAKNAKNANIKEVDKMVDMVEPRDQTFVIVKSKKTGLYKIVEKREIK